MGFRGRLLFFGYPLAEILALWGIASLVGWGWAILGLVAGVPIGLALMRNAGASASQMMRHAQDDPDKASAIAGSSLGQFIAGVLFLIPGYVSDALGIALLIPPVRMLVGRRLSRSMGQTSWMTRMPGFPASGEVIQGTVIVEDLRRQDPPASDGDTRPPIMPA